MGRRLYVGNLSFGTTEETLRAAFNMNLTPMLKAVRKALGVPADPLAAFRASGYEQKAAAERKQKRQDLGLGPEWHRGAVRDDPGSRTGGADAKARGRLRPLAR